MTDWAPIIFAALGSGALGSVITTYGTQTRERGQARAQAREAIRQVQNLTFPLPAHEQLTAALDQLETSAMLAAQHGTVIGVELAQGGPPGYRGRPTLPASERALRLISAPPWSTASAAICRAVGE